MVIGTSGPSPSGKSFVGVCIPVVCDRCGSAVFDCGDCTWFCFDRISSGIRSGCPMAARSRMSPLLSCTTPALVAPSVVFVSKVIIGVGLFTFKDHKNFVLNFWLRICNRCVRKCRWCHGIAVVCASRIELKFLKSGGFRPDYLILNSGAPLPHL
jgi:hypothetical protein